MYFSIFCRVDPLISLARYAAIRLGICIIKTRAIVEQTQTVEYPLIYVKRPFLLTKKNTDMRTDRRTWLVILNKNKYTLWGLPRLLLHVT